MVASGLDPTITVPPTVMECFGRFTSTDCDTH